MDPFTAISLGVSVVGGAAKMIDGFNQKKAAKERMRKLERAALPLNAFEGLQVPTEGLELQREEMQRAAQTQTELLQKAGTRAIAGGIGQVNAAQQEGFRKLGAEFGDKLYEKNIAVAETDQDIQAVKEARLRGQIAQTGDQLAQSRQQIFSGFGDIGTGIGKFGHIQGLEYARKTGNTNPLPKPKNV